jgi:uncharacterized RmlC-like cupin family protein
VTLSATDRFAVVKPGQTYLGKQGIVYGAGASAETVGAEKICMNVMPMPPGARAKVHYHKGIETIAYMLEGECAVYYGDDLERRVVLRAGKQAFCPADVPHAPSNESGAPCTWIVVHSCGSDQDGIVLLPELDAKLTGRLGRKCDPRAPALLIFPQSSAPTSSKKLIPARSRALILPASCLVTEGCLYSIFRRGAGSGGRAMTFRWRCGEAARRSKPHRPGAPTARHGAPLAAAAGTVRRAARRLGPQAVVKRPHNPARRGGSPERSNHRGRCGANL